MYRFPHIDRFPDKKFFGSLQIMPTQDQDRVAQKKQLFQTNLPFQWMLYIEENVADVNNWEKFVNETSAFRICWIMVDDRPVTTQVDSHRQC